jgi:hypothetical protein
MLSIYNNKNLRIEDILFHIIFITISYVYTLDINSDIYIKIDWFFYMYKYLIFITKIIDIIILS